MADMYAELSPDGADHFPVVVAKLAQMHQDGPTLAPSDLATIDTRTLVMLGDDDEVTLEHDNTMYQSIPDAELAIVPGTSHGLMVEKPALFNMILLEFLTEVPVETLAPIRRRT